MASKFQNNEYVEHKQLLFIVSLLLFLSEQGLYDVDPQDISQQAKANIAKLSNHPTWKTQKYEDKRDDPWCDYNYNHTSYSYKDPQSQHFTGIRKHLEEKASEVFQVGLADKGKDLLSDLRDGNIITIRTKLEQDFRNIAIFCHLDKNQLKEAILKMPHRALPYWESIIKERCEIIELTHNSPKLLDELDVWEYLDRELLSNINKQETPMKYFLIRRLQEEVIKVVMSNMEKVIKNNDEQIVSTIHP